MASRNQNRPPRSPTVKKEDEISLDKRRKIRAERMAATNTGRTRQAFTVVNKQDSSAATDMGSTEGSESGNVEFTKEEAEALLNEKPKAKKFDLKAKMEQMTEHNKRLRLCVRWFLKVDENHVVEKENIRKELESAEKKYSVTEMEMKNREAEFNATIWELRKENASLQERVAKEEFEKLDAIENHRRENETRVAAEKLQTSLSEQLEKAQQDIAAANQRASSLDDMYKRLQEYNQSLQLYNAKLQKDLETANESLKKVEKDKLTIVENLSALRGHYNSLQDQLTLSRTAQDEAVNQKESLVNEVKCLRGELQQVREDRDRQAVQVQTLNAEIVKYQESTGKSLKELDCLTTKSKSLEEACSSQREQIGILELQLSAANEKFKRADLSALETQTQFEDQKRTIHELQHNLADAEHQLIEAEILRKKLHNTILELKGNIRVFCRVRPLLPEDGVGTDASVISYPTSVEGLGRGIDVIQSGKKIPFTFDKVFNHDASQKEVFVEISQLIQSALDGYKVCIFAYGQTGSGKTYTMMGRPETSEQKGLIPRSLEQIFQTSQILSAQGWKYKMQASILEIYNETIRDLLAVNKTNGLDLARVENGVPGKQYTIRHDANGNTHVSDLTIVDVGSISEISSLLRQAAQSRSVGKTQMNEYSSRSHFVFTLRISGINETTEQQVQGVLNLIDLAGSERLSRSGATDDRLKETQAINKSLSSLSDVIFALARKEDHVPFRNSKLTYLLQPCLGGDSKTLMFVNISPDPSSMGESLCSLRFAARVNACEIGVPRRQTALRPAADARLSCG
ncbi:kinesin-like protein KIN-14C [Mangifera indica]|uniref:kinesin-like protein KIN-14C n=1 Tax=Mangifera indica TaxID=29780 RepID=UPI001CFBE0E1|nr:kinesin-like protein KIN-14C [Mangifera indica]XP_044462358.1 kinesin-like protein KIN-14C [Mangifera indica]